MIVESHAVYKRPLRLGDKISVVLSPKAISKKIIRFDMNIFKDGEKTTEGYVVQASINPKTWKAIELPDELIARITTI